MPSVASHGLPLCCGFLCWFWWPYTSPRFGPIGLLSFLRFLEALTRPGKRPALNFRDRTIWPGKYESAWDALVRASRGGHLSAAVVFLPKGSRHFGIHDPIPKAEELPGACWHSPLYGEQEPWGCRWWTHWIQNIEEAIKRDAKLQV